MSKEVFYTFIVLLNYGIFFYFLWVNSVYLVLNVISYFRIRWILKSGRFFRKEQAWQSPFSKPISLIVPAFNEEQNIVTSIKALLQMYYPRFEIILVNDGSTDNTLQKLIEEFHLKISPRIPVANIPTKKVHRVYYSEIYDNLFVVDKENGGKADAINVGINFAHFPLVCVIDADSILERDAFIKMSRPFMEHPETIAVGGIVRIANGAVIENGEVVQPRVSKNHWVRFQNVEYLRAFLFGRVGWDYFKSLLIISGAFAVYKRESLIEVGGFATDTVGEDMEIIIRLHRHYRKHKKTYRITFIPEPVCWTEVPEDYTSLKKQRSRWQRGLVQSLVRHREILFNPKFGLMGFFTYPFYYFGEMLGPVVETGGVLFVIISFIFGWVNIPFALFFFFAAVVLGVLLSVSGIALEEIAYHRYPRFEDLMRLTLFSILENFGYRQLHAYWRLLGIIDYFRGKKGWGKPKRKGFQETSAVRVQENI